MPSPDLYADPYRVERIEECAFYHVMDVPGHGVVGSGWDLRGGEQDYLGHVDLAGKRVLEIGPASGFLTFYMESQGAEVVAVELAPDADWDVVPQAGLDVQAIADERRAGMPQLRNAFWFAHRQHGSAARVHYGSVYDLPDDLGHFDLAVMCAVLLHTRDPLRIVEQCARLSDQLLVTDMHYPELGELPVMQLVPSAENREWDTWWRFSPALITNFMGVLGFGDPAVTRHEQRFAPEGADLRMPMFTATATRAPAA
ncbi:MAG: class I SAM-dependent methyltransferase [Solirubrobacteraceae bacterium]